jgi:ribonuclease E
MADTTVGGAPVDEPGAAPESNAPSSPSRARSRRRAAAAPVEGVAEVIPGLETEVAPPSPRSRRRGRAAEAASASPETPSGDVNPAPLTGTSAAEVAPAIEPAAQPTETTEAPAGRRPAKRTRARGGRAAEPVAAAVQAPIDDELVSTVPAEVTEAPVDEAEVAADEVVPEPEELEPQAAEPAPRPVRSTALLFMAPQPELSIEPDPETVEVRPSRRTRNRRTAEPIEVVEEPTEAVAATEPGRSRRARRGRAAAIEAVTEDELLPDTELETAEAPEVEEAAGEEEDDETEAGRRRRRRGRRGRGRGKGPLEDTEAEGEALEAGPGEAPEAGTGDEEPLTRRRRRRRRGGSGGEAEAAEDGVVTVVRVRAPRDEVQGVSGSTRLEAKRQRRRDGREQRRTRPPILTEAEFLARREAVDRVMVVRQKGDRTQVAVLEDGILVEHYVARQSASTMVGNVYLGKVQNVLPSMEAAFVDIGRGRNAVLYAGEVNWDATGLEGRARSIEQALKPGESVLVQVTKDPIGHKGARLTSHIALSGRHLVYVPNGHASGISRKLSDVERRRLRDILKGLVPDGAGVIVRTAAEGASEEDLARDVKRLQSQWDDIQAKAAAGGAPVLLSAEPDLVIRVVRDLFNEDFREVVIQGTEAYEQVEQYLGQVSPELVARVRRHVGTTDVFGDWRIDEQILKGLDRRVFLPSGGHLVIDRTEAMTVIDVNTGKYTGAGGNLEETVTRNNLEAAEEIVRQLRLRDVGGIIVIDFIDMVLEANRELVLRRLTECLGRDRTKHQVTEITSLGLVQMTRKRIGQGLLEAFSETCEHCKGRGVIIQTEPVAERSRASVAEKVRAVAASVANRAAVAEEPELGAVAGLEPVEPVLTESPDGLLTQAEDGALADVESEDEGDDLGGAGEPASARRRARRGSSRRRTRP